jgi:hypothetical protein
MKAGMTWRVASIVALMLVALLLTSCGDSETSSVASTEGSSRTEGTDTTKSSGGSVRANSRKPSKEEEDNSQERDSGGTKSSLSESGPAPTPHRSLPNEGTRKVAPGVPTAKGGDNSIQEFGVESASSDRIAATRTLKTYLDARAGGDWGSACAKISAALKEEFIQYAARQSAQGGPPGCAKALRSLTEGVPASALRTAAAIRVLSMRVKSSGAYLVYKNGEGTPMAIPMTREGGEWKVTALDGSALLLGPGSVY